MLSHNVFAYFMNNPVNMSDPSSNFAWIIAGAAIRAKDISKVGKGKIAGNVSKSGQGSGSARNAANAVRLKAHELRTDFVKNNIARCDLYVETETKEIFICRDFLQVYILNKGVVAIG